MSGIDYEGLGPEIKDAIQSYKKSKGPERGLYEIAQKIQKGQDVSEGERDVFLTFVTGMTTIYGSGESGGISSDEKRQSAMDSIVRGKRRNDLLKELKPKLEELGYKQKGRFR